MALLAGTGSLSGCATAEMPPPRYSARDVAMVRETEPVGTDRRDAADDIAIWRNAADPAASWIVGTDKRAGLYSYGLDGAVRSFLPAGALNNVDLRAEVQWGDGRVILVGASDRSDLVRPAIALFTLDPTTGRLTSLGSVATGITGEAYGFCMGRTAVSAVHAFLVLKDGRVAEFALGRSADGTASARLLRSFGVASQPEGCVVDDRTGQLFLGEEDVGIWRFDLAETAPRANSFAMVGDAAQLSPDVEGLAIAPAGDRSGYLVASSQGDFAYALYDLETARPIGRFRIGGSAGGESTEDTDGIDLALGDFGPEFRDGLFVAQDGDNSPEAQNFKLLSWHSILETLGLR